MATERTYEIRLLLKDGTETTVTRTLPYVQGGMWNRAYDVAVELNKTGELGQPCDLQAIHEVPAQQALPTGGDDG